MVRRNRPAKEQPEANSQISLISDIAAQLLGADNPDVIRQIVGDSVHLVSGARIVIVSRYNSAEESVQIGYITGFERLRTMTERRGWLGYLKSKVPIRSMTDEEYRNFTNGRLNFLEGGVHALSGRNIPKSLCKIMEGIFGVTGIYTMGFSWAGGLFGGISLIMTRGGGPQNVEVVEAITRLGAVTLQRALAETDRVAMEEKLLQAQKMEAVGRLAGGVAHDFNNLLTVISGYSDLALSGSADQATIHEALEEISSAARKASSLTQQLLTFSRRQVTRPEVLNLGKVATDLQAMLTRLVGEHIELSFPEATEEYFVRCDRSQIEQVIINLIANARDAMPEGGDVVLSLRKTEVELDGELTPQLDPGIYVALSVQDAGGGIAPDILEHIFEPFFTTKEKGRGTGLGLATAYGIVRQSGGSIVPKSTPGDGTTMTVFLPSVHSASARSDRVEVKGQVPGGTETILVVEDERAVNKYIAALLEKLGYNVIAAERPTTAIDLCKTHGGSVDLLIADLVMPEMNGRVLSERLSRICPKIKTLFVSGYTEDTVLRHGVQAGSIAFLQKPFDAVELIARVRSILDGSESADEKAGS